MRSFLSLKENKIIKGGGITKKEKTDRSSNGWMHIMGCAAPSGGQEELKLHQGQMGDRLVNKKSGGRKYPT